MNGLIKFFPLQNFVETFTLVQADSSDEEMAQPKETEGSTPEKKVSAKSLSNTTEGSPSNQGLQRLFKCQEEIKSKSRLEPSYFGLYSQCLNREKTWPLCATTKCKKEGEYAVYGEMQNRKPKYCFSCKATDMVHHYNNLKGFLLDNDLLEKYEYNTKDRNAVEVFCNRESP